MPEVRKWARSEALSGLIAARGLKTTGFRRTLRKLVEEDVAADWEDFVASWNSDEKQNPTGSPLPTQKDLADDVFHEWFGRLTVVPAAFQIVAPAAVNADIRDMELHIYEVENSGRLSEYKLGLYGDIADRCGPLCCLHVIDKFGRETILEQERLECLSMLQYDCDRTEKADLLKAVFTGAEKPTQIPAPIIEKSPVGELAVSPAPERELNLLLAAPDVADPAPSAPAGKPNETLEVVATEEPKQEDAPERSSRGKRWPKGTSGNPSGSTISKRHAEMFAEIARRDLGGQRGLSGTDRALLTQAVNLMLRAERAEGPDEAIRLSEAGTRILSDLKRRSRHVDGRTSSAIRFKKLFVEFVNELGGLENLSPIKLNQVSHAVLLSVRMEQMQAELLRGEKIDDDVLVRLSHSVSRILSSLRGKGVAPKPLAPMTTETRKENERLILRAMRDLNIISSEEDLS